MLVEIEAVRSAAIAVAPRIGDGGAVAGVGQLAGQGQEEWMAAVAPKAGNDDDRGARRRVVEVVGDRCGVEGIDDDADRRFPKLLNGGFFA